MQRRVRVENRDEQVIGQHGIHLHAEVDDVLQSDFAFDDDERADLARSESRRREDDLVEVGVLGQGALTQTDRISKRLADVHERGADFGLEEDDDGDRRII